MDENDPARELAKLVSGVPVDLQLGEGDDMVDAMEDCGDVGGVFSSKAT